MPTQKEIQSKKVSQRVLEWGTPLLFAIVILIQTTAFRHSKSPTFDETFYLNCALTTVDNGSIDERICGEGVAPIPVLLNYLPPVWFAGGDERKEVWKGDPSDPPLIDQARLLNSILIGIPTMLLIYIWLYCRRGYTAGLLGAALVTFSPSMTAHFSLATTDACFTLAALVALATLTLYWKHPTKKNLLWLSLTTSIAVSTKYSGIFLFPCILIVMTLIAIQQISDFSKKSLWFIFKRVTIFFTLLLLFTIPLTWAFHLFSFSGPLKTVSYAETPDYSAWVRVLGRGPVAQQIMEISHSHLKRPAPFAGILFQFLHNSGGHDAYLMGDVSLTGWWYYFPMSWLLKSTPVELILTLLGFVLTLFFIRDVWKTIRRSPENSSTHPAAESGSLVSKELTNHAPIVWLLAIFVLLFMLLTSRLNLGQRYLLTLYPLLFLFTIDQFWRWFQHKTILIVLLCFSCIGFQLVSITSVQPHYLAYFNSSIGGPAFGHRYLLDSNLDWGQDLPALKAILAELPEQDREQCLIYYFGTARPEAYSLNAHSLNDPLPADLERRKYLVLSANYLQGLYTHSKDPFAAFRNIEPVKRAGYSLFVYDLSTPEAKQALQQAVAILQKMHEDKKTEESTQKLGKVNH